MPDKKWQKQTDEDEFRQILRASASAENERNATVSGLESVRLGQHQHQHWDFGGGCHNFRSTQKGDKTPVSTLALSQAQLLSWETTLIS